MRRSARRQHRRPRRHAGRGNADGSATSRIAGAWPRRRVAEIENIAGGFGRPAGSTRWSYDLTARMSRNCSRRATEGACREGPTGFPQGVARQPGQAMMALHAFVRNCGLEPSLLELVKLRASQLNGCAHCIDMHTQGVARRRRKRAAALPARRLARVAALQRSRARRAGLDRSGDAGHRGHVPDDVYDRRKRSSARRSWST